MKNEINKGILIDTAKNYFKSWEDKNIEYIKTFFSEDIVLIDNDINIKGIDNIIEHNSDALSKDIKILIICVDSSVKSYQIRHYIFFHHSTSDQCLTLLMR